MNKTIKFLGKIWTIIVFPALKAAKPALRKWAKKKLIPELQKKINAGAIDQQVDDKIKEVILNLIDKI